MGSMDQSKRIGWFNDTMEEFDEEICSQVLNLGTKLFSENEFHPFRDAVK